MKRTGQKALHGLVLVGGLAVLLAGGLARAQGPEGGSGPGESPADSRSAAFRAVEGPTKESIPGGPLLLAAYGVAWVVVFVLVRRIQVRQAANDATLAKLTRALEERSADGGPPRRADH